jgi:hypothetical protein
MRRNLLGAVLVSAVAAVACAPAAVAGKPISKPKHKVPSVHLCAWLTAAGAAGSLNLEGSCTEKHGTPKTHHTPLGSETSTFYSASWREEKPTLELVPRHTLGVAVTHITGSAAVISFFQKQERASVLENGVLVASSKGVLASWAGDTYSCKNPPTGDCTKNEFESTKGTWGVILDTSGAPPTGPEEAKDESSGDEPEDLAQEELLKSATVGLGLLITAKI